MTDESSKARLAAINQVMREIEKQFTSARVMPLGSQDLQNRKLGAVTRLDAGNYRSIKSASIRFTDLTILVGTNGSGKSNLLDCLAFLSESLRFSCDYAISSRGGIQSLVRNTQRSGSYFSLKLYFILENSHKYTYKIKIKRPKYREFEIAEEILTKDSKIVFKVLSGKVEMSIDEKSMPTIDSSTLFLSYMSSRKEYDEIRKFISNIRSYSPNVSAIRELALPDTSSTLSKGAENIANLVDRAKYHHKMKLNRYLRNINPIIQDFRKRKFGKMQAVHFTMRNNRYYLYPDNMSDGTLRAFALLVAIFQDEWENVPKLSLICIEEPETGLHPAAASVMIDAITEASKATQIIITTHSADILENVNPDVTNIIYTSINKDNSTKFSTISAETMEIIRKGLYNPGELLRMGQLN